MAAAIQLVLSTYASYVGEQVHYGEWLKVILICDFKDHICVCRVGNLFSTALQVRMYSRALAIIGSFLILASGAGEVYRQKARSRSLQSTGQIFLGVYLICMVSIFF